MAWAVFTAPVFCQPADVKPSGEAGYVLPDGTIQIVGWEDLSGLFEQLNANYVRSHSSTKFKFVSGNNMATQHSLIYDETVFAPIGADFSTGLNSAYKALVKAPTFRIAFAHGSLSPSAKLSPLAIVVHRSNPLERLTPNQLLHIFTVGGRAPDINFWKQAGVKGELAEQEIHSYGLPESDHYPSEDLGFGAYLFRDKWGMSHNARHYRMLETYADVTAQVAKDPSGIGITALNRVTGGVKVVGIAAGEWGKPFTGTREEVLSGRYPFDRQLYIYVRRKAGEPLDPFIKEYLRMVLSPQGQEVIGANEKGYLPLNAHELAAELGKLD